MLRRLQRVIKNRKLASQFSTSATEPKTALVTGGNRGIGLEACKQLRESGFNVIMTSRSLESGNAVIEKHFAEDKVPLLQLDISNPESIQETASYIMQNVDQIDVLVNNAGIHYNYERKKYEAHLSKPEKIEHTIATNYYGTLSLTQELLPYLKNTRIICLSNRDSALRKLSDELRNEFLREDLDEDKLNALMERYKKDAINGDHSDDKDIITTANGWINSYYLMSYVGVNAYCRLLGNRLKNDPNNNWVGAYCPGHCATDSRDYFGARKPSESAFGIHTLSTMMLNEYTPNGCFWAAFIRAAESDDPGVVELEIMDLITPNETISWDLLCDSFVTDSKIQAFE